MDARTQWDAVPQLRLDVRRPTISDLPHLKRPVGRPRRPKEGEAARDTHAEALIAAERLLHERGYAGAKMEDVALAVGVTKATLYHHFPSKEALVVALAHRVLNHDEAGVQQAIASSAQPTEQLRAVAGWMFGQRRQTERLLRDLTRFLPESHQGEIYNGFMTQLYGHIHAVVEAGIQRGEFRAHDPAFTTWAFLGLLSEFSDIVQDTPVLNLEDQLLDFVLRGIQAAN